MSQDLLKEKKVDGKDKPNQINKYSIYELKSAMDTAIIDVKK